MSVAAQGFDSYTFLGLADEFVKRLERVQLVHHKSPGTIAVFDEFLEVLKRRKLVNSELSDSPRYVIRQTYSGSPVLLYGLFPEIVLNNLEFAQRVAGECCLQLRVQVEVLQKL